MPRCRRLSSRSPHPLTLPTGHVARPSPRHPILRTRLAADGLAIAAPAFQPCPGALAAPCPANRRRMASVASTPSRLTRSSAQTSITSKWPSRASEIARFSISRCLTLPLLALTSKVYSRVISKPFRSAQCRSSPYWLAVSCSVLDTRHQIAHFVIGASLNKRSHIYLVTHRWWDPCHLGRLSGG